MSETLVADVYVPPMGPRFTQLYVDRGVPNDDSPRLRNRVAAFFKTEMYEYTSAASNAIETRIGTDYRFTGYAHAVAEYLRVDARHRRQLDLVHELLFVAEFPAADPLEPRTQKLANKELWLRH